MVKGIFGEPLVVGLYTGMGSTTLTDRLSSSDFAVLRKSVTQAGAPYSDPAKNASGWVSNIKYLVLFGNGRWG